MHRELLGCHGPGADGHARRFFENRNTRSVLLLLTVEEGVDGAVHEGSEHAHPLPVRVGAIWIVVQHVHLTRVALVGYTYVTSHVVTNRRRRRSSRVRFGLFGNARVDESGCLPCSTHHPGTGHNECALVRSQQTTACTDQNAKVGRTLQRPFFGSTCSI